MPNKTCTRCKIELPDTPENFYPKCPYCKKCKYEKMMESYHKRTGGKTIKRGEPFQTLPRLPGETDNEYYRRHNQLFPIRRSDEIKKHIETLKGTNERMVVI